MSDAIKVTEGGEVTVSESEASDLLEEKLASTSIGSIQARKSGPGCCWSPQNNIYCGVLNCPSTTASCKDRWFFKLPVHSHEPERRALWLEKIRRPDVQTHHRLLVCDRHFDPNDIGGPKNGIITNKSRKYLKKGVIPTLHLPAANKKIQKNLHQTRPKHVYKRIDQTVNKTIGYEEPSTSGLENELKNLNSQKEDLDITITDNADQIKPNTSIENENTSTSSLYEAEHSISLHKELEPSPTKTKTITNIKLEDNEKQLLLTLCDELKLDSELLETFIKLKLKFKKEPYNDNRKYSDECKFLICEMYYEYPRCYEILQDILSLPPQSAIKSFMPSSEEVLNGNGMQSLLAKLCNINETMKLKQNYGVLCLDFLKITPQIDYDYERDIIYGIDKQAVRYKFAIIAMARGISDDWHQVVSVFFFHNISFTTFHRYREWTDKLMLSMYKFGISIIAVVTTTDDFFVQAYSIRESPIQNLSLAGYYYLENGYKIWHIFDPLHLVLCLYEELQHNLFIYNDNCTANWDHVKEFYLRDAEREVSFSEKSSMILSEDSQQEKLISAANILIDQTIATGMLAFADMGILGEEARNTANFLKIISESFKIVCPDVTSLEMSGTTYAKPSHRQTEPDKKTKKRINNEKKAQKSSLIKQLQYLKNFKTCPKSGENKNEKYIKCSVTSFRNLLSIIGETKILEVSTKSEVSEVIRKFNLNPLIEYIDRLKLKSRQPLTAKLLMETLNESLIQKEGGNKIHVFFKYADRLIDIERFSEESNMSLVLKDHRRHINDYSAFSYDDGNSFMYVATYLLEKVYKQFRNVVSIRIKLMNSSVHYVNRGSGFSGTIIIPDDEFLQLVIDMDTVFVNYWRQAIQSGKWFTKLKEEMSKPSADIRYSGEAETLDFIKDLFIHLRIYHVVKYNQSMYEKGDELHQFVVKRLEGYKIDHKKVQLPCLDCFRNP